MLQDGPRNGAWRKWLEGCCVLWLLLFSTQVFAQEKRFALLVAHEQGWKTESKLAYVVKGDLLPLAKQLQGIGFQVWTLVNPSPARLRSTLLKAKKMLKKNSGIGTFFFYYSGHADRKTLHLGRRSRTPVTYRELASFFRKLSIPRRIAVFDACYSGEIIRRFGSIDRYKRLVREGRTKGIRTSHPMDLHKMLKPKQGHEKGLRIIASSLGVSWELKNYKASIFTHYMLKGLKGSADTNRDGRLTIDELFDYTSQRVKQETGQRPLQLVMLERSEPYALAPVYRSSLRIDSRITGKIKISVANFIWTTQKLQRGPLLLAVVDGRGTIELQKNGRCQKQQIFFPKGQQARLSKRWTQIRCQSIHSKPKGKLFMDAQLYEKERLIKPLALSLLGNYQQIYTPLQDSIHWGASFHLRWARFLGLGLHIAHGIPESKAFRLTFFVLRPEVGKDFLLLDEWFEIRLWMGGYMEGGLLMQYNFEQESQHIFIAGAGGLTELSFWFGKHWALRLGLYAGLRYTPSQHQDTLAFFWQSSVGCTFAF